MRSRTFDGRPHIGGIFMLLIQHQFIIKVLLNHSTGWPKKKDTETVFWDKFDKDTMKHTITRSMCA